MAVKRSNATRERIKDVAQRLIAEHGVDGIAIRDIVTAAGQRNMASLHYYFRTKDELIKELISDAAEVMRRASTAQFLRLAEIGETLSVRQLVHVLVSGSKLDPHENHRNATIMRFIGAVSDTHHHLFVQAVGYEHSDIFEQCLDLIRVHLRDVPPAALQQRIDFFLTAFTAILIARESALALGIRARSYWSDPSSYTNMLDFLCGALEAPVSRSRNMLSARDDADSQISMDDRREAPGDKGAAVA